MIILSLNQFGSIMTFAIDIEEKLSQYYEAAAGKVDKYAEEFKKRAKSSRDRKRKLERSRRENVTEITLEPVEGLDENDYKISSNLNDYSVVSVNTIEKIVLQFYADVTPKINVLESRRVLKRCYKEHNKFDKLQ